MGSGKCWAHPGKLLALLLPRKNGTTAYKLLPPEAVFANTLGLLILLFGVLVLGALSRPSWKRPDADSPDSCQVPAPLWGDAGHGVALGSRAGGPASHRSPGWPVPGVGRAGGRRHRAHPRSPHSPCSPPSADACRGLSLPSRDFQPRALHPRRSPACSASPAFGLSPCPHRGLHLPVSDTHLPAGGTGTASLTAETCCGEDVSLPLSWPGVGFLPAVG